MSPADRERYSRQILFPGIGEEGQQKLLDSHVAIVGCGALGSFQAAALARAGVGRLTIIDRDYVEPSNLQRQWLFEEADAAAGVLNSITAAIAAFQAADALRWLATGSVEARITTLDVWSGAVRRIEWPARDPDCPACALRQFPYLNGDRRAPISLCGRNAVQI